MHAGLLGAQLRDDGDAAALMLGCFCISDLLFLIVPSLCVLLQPLAQSDSTFLIGAGPCDGGGGCVPPRFLNAVEGSYPAGADMHVASCSSASYKHVFSSWESPLSQFPPLASHLQDVEEPRPKGRVCPEVAGCGSHGTAVT